MTLTPGGELLKQLLILFSIVLIRVIQLVLTLLGPM
jgi:hypothetical protein